MPDSMIKRERWGGIELRDAKGKLISRSPVKLNVVARDDKGRIITWKRWTPKIPIDEDRRRFKSSGNISFIKDVTADTLKNVIEVSDFSDRPSSRRKPRTGNYQYVIKGRVEGKSITARSRNHDHTFPVNRARDEALTSFYERLAQSFGLDYDEDEGRQLANQLGKTLIIREGVVYYKKRG